MRAPQKVRAATKSSVLSMKHQWKGWALSSAWKFVIGFQRARENAVW